MGRNSSDSVVPTYRAEQVREAEEPLLTAGEPLMARAAGALAQVAAETLEGFDDGGRPRVLVLAGSGNNGGDALFAAALFARTSSDAEIDVLLVSDRWHKAGLEAALDAGVTRISPQQIEGRVYSLVLDGLLGIGTASDPSLRGTAREAVETLLPSVNAGTTRVIAVDIPSGLHPDTGSADDAVLPALITVTFGAAKQGLAVGRGPELAGEVVLVRIGIDEQLDETVPVGEIRVNRILNGVGA